MHQKLWAGRFTTATNPDVEQYTASIHFDRELAFEDILGSLAHAAMLAYCNIILSADYDQLQKGLKQLAQRIGQDEVAFRVEDEDIHMNIERLLSESIGDVAGKLHTARSRNDQVALDLHLYLRKKIVGIIDLLSQLQDTMLQLAKTHSHVILPGYTHLQRAQPILLAEHWFAYVEMFQRDIERLKELWKRVNVSPLGACALAGTTFPIDKNYVAEALGFDGIYINTLDAVSDRDFIVEFLSAGALIMMHISRLSEELILWSSQEFNFISLNEAYCTGSSIMPQKKNPDIAELGRGKTGRVYGALFSLLTTLKGLPLAYNKDLQEDKEPLFDTVKTLYQTLSIYIPLLSTLKINTENMRGAVEHGYLNATALAEYLVKRGMTFRAAHTVVGKIVSLCLAKKCRIEDLPLRDMQQFISDLNEEVYQVLISENIVAAYQACLSVDLKTQTLKNFQEQVHANQAWASSKIEFLMSLYARFEVPFII